MRIRFWSWVMGLAHRRLNMLCAESGHQHWWRDFETGLIFFDEEAERASAVLWGRDDV